MNRDGDGHDDEHLDEEGIADYFLDDRGAAVRADAKGPLNVMPSFALALPALLGFVLFVMFSLVYWLSPYRDYLWASGATVFSGEYWRLATALFTHADLGHLLANAPLFIIFGWFLHAYFGKLLFPGVAFVLGIVSNLLALLYYEPHVRLVGASGMLYGMVGLWLVFYIRYDTEHRVAVRIFRAVGFSLIMLSPTTFNARTSHIAHAAGFFTGTLAAFVLLPWVRVRNPGEKIS